MNVEMFPRVHPSQNTGKVFTYSHDMAEFFGKKHKNVIRLIREILEENKNLAAQFRAAKYDHRGKKLPCYKISEEGFGYLIMKFTGKQFDHYKMMYAEQFTAMRYSLKNLEHSKLEAREMCAALEEKRALDGKSTESYHYMNEHKLCDSVLLGCSLADYKKKNGFAENAPVSDVLTAEQITTLDSIRTENHKLLGEGMEYDDRKRLLMQHFRFVIKEIPAEYLVCVPSQTPSNQFQIDA